MNITAWIGLAVTIVTVLLIPLVAFLIRGAIKWTRVEVKLEQLAEDIRSLVEDKDKVHHELYDAMSKDREATNTRLRYLEEKIWSRKE